MLEDVEKVLKAVEAIRDEVKALDIIRSKWVNSRLFILLFKKNVFIQCPYRTYSDYERTDDKDYVAARACISLEDLTEDEFYLLKKVLVDSPKTKK